MVAFNDKPVSTIVGCSPAVSVFDSLNVIFPGISMSKRCICIITISHELLIKLTQEIFIIITDDKKFWEVEEDMEIIGSIQRKKEMI